MLRRAIAGFMTLALLLAIVSAMPCFAAGIASGIASKADVHGCCEPSTSVKAGDCCGSFAPSPATASDAAPVAAFFLQAATYASNDLATGAAVSVEIPASAQTSRRIPATILRT